MENINKLLNDRPNIRLYRGLRVRLRERLGERLGGRLWISLHGRLYERVETRIFDKNTYDTLNRRPWKT